MPVILFLLLLPLQVLECSTILHEFHLSKTQVHFNSESKALEVSLHLFIDDLEDAMALEGVDSLYIATTKEHPKADLKIEKYIEDYFQVTVDGQQVEFNFLGKEVSDDLFAIWCYMEATDIVNPEAIIISNHLLINLYDDQKNMLSFSGPEIKKYFLMDNKTQEAAIQL